MHRRYIRKASLSALFERGDLAAAECARSAHSNSTAYYRPDLAAALARRDLKFLALRNVSILGRNRAQRRDRASVRSSVRKTIIGHVIMFIPHFPNCARAAAPIARIDRMRGESRQCTSVPLLGIGTSPRRFTSSPFIALHARARLQFYDKTTENVGYDLASRARFNCREQSPR